jgi:hypothetical protein
MRGREQEQEEREREEREEEEEGRKQGRRREVQSKRQGFSRELSGGARKARPEQLSVSLSKNEQSSKRKLTGSFGGIRPGLAGGQSGTHPLHVSLYLRCMPLTSPYAYVFELL